MTLTQERINSEKLIEAYEKYGKEGNYYIIEHNYKYIVCHYTEVIKSFRDKQTALMVCSTLNKVKSILESKKVV